VELGGGSVDAGVEEMSDMLGTLLSVETITVLDRLGFNFRRAIGEPLTSLVAGLILAKAPGANSDHEVRLAQMGLETAYRQVMQDDEAFARYQAASSERQG
jgi:hypothetical protein